MLNGLNVASIEMSYMDKSAILRIVHRNTVAEIASFWKLSEDTIRTLFEREPDVPVIESPKPRYGRRRYSTLRIPDFVVERVHRRQSRR
jgi:Uma2 family endonuclease